MTDILERLRMPPRPHETIAVFVFLCREAADEIERMRGLISSDGAGEINRINALKLERE